MTVWIKELLENLDSKTDESTRKSIMEACGEKCPYTHLSDARLIEIRNESESDTDFLAALCREWRLKKETGEYYVVFDKCYCPMVNKNIKGASKTLCYCTLGNIKHKFRIALGREVEVEMRKTVLAGDDECRFHIRFDDSLQEPRSFRPAEPPPTTPKQEMEIRPYLKKDREEVLSLWTECGLVMPQNDPAKDIKRKLKVDADLFLVGCNENGIVATAMGGYEGHRGWVNYLAVKPSLQGSGLGRQMMEAVEARIKEKGCPKINLQVRETNERVIGFYRALGYVSDNVIGLGKRLEHD